MLRRSLFALPWIFFLLGFFGMVCPCGSGRPERYFLPRIIFIAIIRRGVNLALAGRFCLAAEFGEDFVFLENHVFLVVNLDIVSRVLSEQDSIAHFYIKRDAVALFVELAGADGDDFAFLGFFFCRVRDDDSTLHGFLLFEPLYQDAVV